MKRSNETKQLFLKALELELEERQAFLAELALRDSKLAERVGDLVVADEAAEQSMAAASGASTLELRGPELAMRFGNFDLLEVLGEGGSGVVYRAHQRDLGRVVALKLLRAGRLATPAETQRFRLEAEAAARLDHPSIVPIYEAGTYDGRQYISMRLIDGQSLAHLAARYRADPRTAAALLVSISRAVEHGHRHGVLHRDLKPSNILIDAEEEAPHVVDFGTAKLLDDGERNTLTGVIVGTPAYMAPEQVDSHGEVSVATDVYALGCILYELLTGGPPFEAGSLAETLRLVQEAEPKQVRAMRPGVDRDLETICHTCLAKEPRRRYSSAATLAEDLERWLRLEPIQARRARLTERVRLAWRRRPLVAALATAIAALVVVLLVGTVAVSLELQDRLVRVRAAEKRTDEQLRAAYLAEARALRQSHRSEQLAPGLSLVSKAAEIYPGVDLTSEAVALIARTDLVTELEWERDRSKERKLFFDTTLELYVSSGHDGTGELRRASDQSTLLELPGNGSIIHNAKFSANGRYLALTRHGPALEKASFEVWDLHRQVVVHSVAKVPISRQVAFAPDRPVLAVSFDEERLVEIDVLSGEEIELAQLGPDEAIYALAYSPDGTQLAATCWEDQLVRLYSRPGSPPRLLDGPDTRFVGIAWSPSGARLVAGGWDFGVYVWDVSSGELETRALGHRGEVIHVFFPTDELIASYSWDHTTRLWDALTGSQLQYAEEELHAVSSDGARLAFLDEERVRVKRLHHNDVLQRLRGHEGKNPRCMDVHPLGRLAITGGTDGLILWDLESGARLDEAFPEDVTSVLFGLERTLLVGSDSGLEQWKIEDGRLSGPSLQLHVGKCLGIATDRSRKQVAVLTASQILFLEPDGKRREVYIDRPRGGERLALSADGERVALGSWRGAGVHVWSSRDGSLLAHLVPDRPNCSVSFSPDGLSMAIGTGFEHICYDTESWKPSWRFARWGRNRFGPSVLCFHPTGKLLAATVGQREVGLVSSSTGELLVVLEPPEIQTPRAAHFTPDGNQLLVGTDFNRVLLWDLDRLKQALSEAGLEAEFGPDAKVLNLESEWESR